MSASGPTGLSATGVNVERQKALQIRYFVGGLALLAATALVWPLLGRGVEQFQFMPHVFCYLDNPTLITVNLSADLLIGVSYVVISLTLVYLVRASQGAIPFHWMFLAFGTFIIACGGTHFMEAITLWHPYYWAAAYVKVVTALASVATAVALPVVMPNVLKNIESMRVSEERAVQLAQANRELSTANDKLHELDRLRRRFVAQAAANMGDWEWDIPSGVVRWSPEVEDIHGLPRGTFKGGLEDWLNTLHPDDRERSLAAAQRAVQLREDYEVEYRTSRPDGGYCWTTSRGSVEYDGNAEPLRMAGMSMDISTRKGTEEALRRTEKLAAAGRLAATIAHEINNPLEAVTNLIFLARVEQSQDASRRLLEAADHELQRVSHITRQTLGFYRETTTPIDIELSEILKSVVDVFRRKLDSRDVKAVIETDSAVYLQGVPGELRQVVANLLGNAIDASPAGSSVRIRVKKVGDAAQITIADHGTGIPEAVRKQVFEPFFTTKKDVGTGLGLWISKEIVKNHGGKLRFRSNVNPGKCGTVFVVYLSNVSTAQSTAA
jgi:PAS domain S-box-containing protein